MSTREEIEAAVEWWRGCVVNCCESCDHTAMEKLFTLANAYLAERQQRERDQQPPTREIFERLASRLGDAVQWHDDFEFPELCIAEHGSVFLTETRHLRAACLLLGIETDGIL